MGQQGQKPNAKGVIEHFCLFLEQKGLSQTTIKNYRCDLEGFVRWFESGKNMEFKPEDLTPIDFKRYRELLIQSYKPSSTNRKLAAIKAFLRWAVNCRLLIPQGLPDLRNVEAVRNERSRPRWLDQHEQSRFLQAVEAGGKACDIAAIKVMLHTGLRVLELCELRWNSVKIGSDKGMLILKREKGDGDATVPLNMEVRNALLSLRYQHRPGKDEIVFAGRSGLMTRRAVDMLVDRYAKVAGIENVTPGTLRHTFCMNMVSAGVSPYTIARLIGKGNMEMIRCYYVPQDSASKLRVR